MILIRCVSIINPNLSYIKIEKVSFQFSFVTVVKAHDSIISWRQTFK